MSPVLPTFLIAVALAAVHVGAGTMRTVEDRRRSRWLSAAGGASAAYIFVHVLPYMAAAHAREGMDSEKLYFLIALAGLVGYYGIERHVRLAAERAGGTRRGIDRVFWVHVGSFAFYSLVIGCLLLDRDAPGLASLLLYGGAMGLHFLSMDYGMRLEHAEAYDRIARWILASAVLAGWLVGWLLEVPRAVVDGLFAFLAGGLVLNVMKEELPEERRSSFGAFVAGAAGYGALLVVLE
ncbi:hypothetical protein [Coralloluteibacterium thermophilus]|uniref:ZIP Zinc transporter n=1 Tax=Coralloluteibacterium thermophilum TaxID=2707049 RepID=A0ABV9NGL0_9GAMM